MNMNTNTNTSEKTERKGLFLKYRDFKILEKIIEEYNISSDHSDDDMVDFSRMSKDEKDILWKIKTIIRNMESVRLRSQNQNKPEGKS